MKRNIIVIDEDKCTGCGLCITNCPEGALQIIEGKARVVHEFSCDGLGACIGHCPEGAITIEEREAQAYDEKKVMANIVKAGEATLKAHLKHLKEHDQKEYLSQAFAYLTENNIPVPDYGSSSPLHTGCPGMRTIDFNSSKDTSEQPALSGDVHSQLSQWPLQLTLLNPHAPYFNDADLLLAADCVPFSYGNFHNRFLKGRKVIVFCPKLDESLDMYVEKLATLIKDNSIKSITVTRMEVPCCGGVTRILEEALRKSGKNIVIKEYTISLKGEII